MSFDPKPWNMQQELPFPLKTQPAVSPTNLIALQYKCRLCSRVFDKHETCEEHLQTCGTKLLNPVSFVLRGDEEVPVYSAKDNVVNIIKSDPNFNVNDDIEECDIVVDAYEVGGEGFGLEDEETTDTHFSTSNTDMNQLIEDLNNDLIEIDTPNRTSNTSERNNTDDNIKVETSEQPVEEHELIIETFTDHSSNEEGIKILRVLKNKPAKQPEVAIDKPNVKPKMKRKPPARRQVEVIDVKPVQQAVMHDPKPKQQVRTYAEKNPKTEKGKSNRKNKKIVVKPGKKLYSVIEHPKEVPEQTEVSVFDFVDEEDERRKAEDEKRRKKLKEIKDRTCQICKDMFDDPIDLLRHKREKHPRNKVKLPKDKLKVYLELECRPICPLCFKQITLYHFRSMFTKHILTHAEEMDFECKICGQKYKRKDHLDSHEKKHVFGLS